MAARTSCPPRPGGRKSRTTRWIGPSGTRSRCPWPGGSRAPRGRPAAYRRGAAHPRPSRRQPRRRRPRAAAVGRRRGHHGRGRLTTARQRARPGAVGLDVTATPCRHGPPASRPIVGDVIGFALRWEGQQHGVLWISGDTVLYDGVRQVARRLRVGTALLHLGGVRFPVTGPVRYTMTAADAVTVCRLVQPRTLIPVHYEGWGHFQQGRDAVERAFAGEAEDVRGRVRWLPIGTATQIAS